MKTQTTKKEGRPVIAFLAFAGLILFCMFGESLIDGLLKLIYGL